MNTIKEFCVYEPDWSISEYFDNLAFEYHKDRPMHWLQKFCLWILKKLKCQRAVRMKSAVYNRIFSQSVIDIIRRQSGAIEKIIAKRCKYVLLGNVAMRELKVETFNRQIGFDMNVPLACGRDYHMEVFGIRVVLVPWFDGVLCLGDLDDYL